MRKVQTAIGKLLFALLATMASAPLWALGSGPDGSQFQSEASGDMTDLSTIQEFLHWLVSGPGGNIIVILGVIVALIMMVSSATMRPILFVLGLAVVVGWGPGLFMWIASSGAEMDVVTAWVASR